MEFCYPEKVSDAMLQTGYLSFSLNELPISISVSKFASSAYGSKSKNEKVNYQLDKMHNMHYRLHLMLLTH